MEEKAVRGDLAGTMKSGTIVARWCLVALLGPWVAGATQVQLQSGLTHSHTHTNTHTHTHAHTHTHTLTQSHNHTRTHSHMTDKEELAARRSAMSKQRQLHN